MKYESHISTILRIYFFGLLFPLSLSAQDKMVSDTIYVPRYWDPNKLDCTNAKSDKVYIKVERDLWSKNGSISTMIRKNKRYPKVAAKENPQGNTVKIQFVVDSDRSIRDIVVLTSASPSLDAEAVRVVNELEISRPAEKYGKPVAVQIVAPISFFEVKRPHDILSTNGLWLPEYRGGLDGLHSYLKSNLRYPKSSAVAGLYGTVLVRFEISNEGKVLNPEIVKGMDTECNDEAVRVVSQMEDWLPGIYQGKYVSIFHTLPIHFRLR